MLNVAVIFGGVSCEHDISIITGEQLISYCDDGRYNVIPIYIDKSGMWWTGDNLKDIDNFKVSLRKSKQCSILPCSNELFLLKGKKCKSYVKIDVAILCLHGKNGEDGAIPALLELSQIPYSSCGISASAICLDKGICKKMCKAIDIPVVRGNVVSENCWSNKDDLLQCVNDLDFPVILKPCRLGSSIGISICKNECEFENRLLDAFKYDDCVLIENFVDIEKEINIAVFDDKGEIVFSDTEEPVRHDEILSFDEKYRKNSGGFEAIKRISPAIISEDLERKIKSLAEKCYRNFNLFGIVRFDFILDKAGNLYLNEINTIPGSMANYLFDREKYSYRKLIDIMISNAIHRRKLNDKLIKTIDTDVIENDFDGFKK